jgi:hypothetical protein
MSIGGEGVAGYEPDEAAGAMPAPGTHAALDLLVDHIAAELAMEYVDRMRTAAAAPFESETTPMAHRDG